MRMPKQRKQSAPKAISRIRCRKALNNTVSYSSSKSPLATSTTSSPPHHELATPLRARHLITNSPLHYELATSPRARHLITNSPPHHELATSLRARHFTTSSPPHHELATSPRARHLQAGRCRPATPCPLGTGAIRSECSRAQTAPAVDLQTKGPDTRGLGAAR